MQNPPVSVCSPERCFHAEYFHKSEQSFAVLCTLIFCFHSDLKSTANTRQFKDRAKLTRFDVVLTDTRIKPVGALIAVLGMSVPGKTGQKTVPPNPKYLGV